MAEDLLGTLKAPKHMLKRQTLEVMWAENYIDRVNILIKYLKTTHPDSYGKRLDTTPDT